MKVRVLFIHPTRGLHDVVFESANSVEEVVTKLKEIGCGVMSAEEEVTE